MQAVMHLYFFPKVLILAITLRQFRNFFLYISYEILPWHSLSYCHKQANKQQYLEIMEVLVRATMKTW
jgi:hypothetical protein